MPRHTGGIEPGRNSGSVDWTRRRARGARGWVPFVEPERRFFSR